MTLAFRAFAFPWLLTLCVTVPLAGCFGPSETSSFQVAVQGLYDAQLSTDGRSLIVASVNHGGSFWDVASQARRYNWNSSDGDQTVLVAVALAGDGSYGITVDQVPIMVLWDAKTGRALKSWLLTHKVTSLALADRGSRLFIGTKNNEALVFDLYRGGIERRLVHDGGVNDVAITADGRLGLTVADDHLARLWDLNQGKELRRWDLDNNGMTAALSANGRYAFAAAQSARAAVWNAQTGATLLELNPYQQWMKRGTTYSSACFSSNEDELLTGSLNGEVKRWSLRSGEALTTWMLGKRSWLTPSAVKLISLAYPRSGDYTAVGSNGLVYQLSNPKP